MDEYISTLDSECPTVKDEYLTKLDDLNVEMSQMFMKLYQEDLTQEQFNAMLARIDAEKVATGISDITVNKAVKAGKVYSLDGKRVSKSAKGLAIINGKKVILK